MRLKNICIKIVKIYSLFFFTINNITVKVCAKSTSPDTNFKWGSINLKNLMCIDNYIF